MSSEIRDFYDLEAWRKGHSLVLDIYELTGSFPKEEKYGLTLQIRRCTSSVTANIAEGFARYHFKDKIRFYHQARGSVAETQNFLLLSKDLKLIDDNTFQPLMNRGDEVRKIINGLIKTTERARNSQRK